MRTDAYNTHTVHLKIKQEVMSTHNAQNDCKIINHKSTPDDIMGVKILTPEACTRLTEQVSGGQRQNINREGCVSDENDFASQST